MRSYNSVSTHSSHGATGYHHTEIALISGSSLSPRLLTPVKLPASKHRLAHGRVNNMVAQCAQSSETSKLLAGTVPIRNNGQAQRKYKALAPAIGSRNNKRREEERKAGGQRTGSQVGRVGMLVMSGLSTRRVAATRGSRS